MTCTRPDPLAAGGSHPSIVLAVRVSTFAASGAIDVAQVAGGGNTDSLNNLSLDRTTIR